MDAAYNKKTAVVVLDASEVRLIMRALDVLRYSEPCKTMTGSQLVNLAGLSAEWLGMTQDIGSPDPERITQTLDIADVISKIVREIYGPECSWEVY